MWDCIFVFMEFLSNYIVELIKYHDCVIVPGFGAFVVNYSSSELQNNTIIAPYKKVTFNSALSHNDGLLCKYISENENISFEEAFSKIRSVIGHVLDEIESGIDVQINGLGVVKPYRGIMVFEPSVSKDVNIQNFGLQEVTLSKLNLAILEKHDSKQKVNPSIIRWSAAAAVVILAFLFTIPVADTGLTNFAGWKTDFINSIPIEVNSQIQPVLEDEVSITVESIKERTESSNPKTELTEKTKEVSIIENHYHLIVGSLPDMESAIKQQKYLLRLGYDNIEIIDCGNRFRLSIKSFQNFTTADSFSKTFRKENPLLSDAWVFKK